MSVVLYCLLTCRCKSQLFSGLLILPVVNVKIAGHCYFWLL